MIAAVAGTFDTKGEELRFMRDLLKDAGVRTRLVDLSTSGKPSSADIPPQQVALYHRRGHQHGDHRNHYRDPESLGRGRRHRHRHLGLTAYAARPASR